MRIETDRRYRAIVVGLLLCFAAATAYLALVSRQADPDMFWHIATGRQILASGTVPSTDVFSWYGIEHHLSWMPQSWLFGVLAYAAWLLGGFRLLYVATAIAAAAIVGLVYWLFALRSGNRLLALAVAAVSLLGLLPAAVPRPQMLTYALLLVLALLLEKRRWWWALPVVLLGVNVHGPVYPVYLLVVAYYVLPRCWPVLAACAACVLATPSGVALFPYPFLSLLGPGSPIQEFARVAPVDWPAYLVALLALLFLLDRRRMPFKESVAFAMLVVLSLAALRHMVFMFVLILPLVAPYLRLPSQSVVRTADQPCNGTSDPSAGDSPSPASAHAMRRRRLAALDPALVIVLLVCVIAIGVRGATLPFDPYRDYPEQASQYLREHGVTRYFNEWGDGGFLIFREMQPLIDGRGEQYYPYPGRSTVTLGPEYVSAFLLEVDCRPFLKENRITHVLILQATALGRVLEQSSSFRAVYHDDRYAIYEFLD